MLNWLIHNRQLVFILCVIVAFEIVILSVYTDWKAVVFSLAHFALVLLFLRLIIGHMRTLETSKSAVREESRFLPVPLRPGIGNSYISKVYLDPPFGNIVLGGVEFQIDHDSLIFDTNSHIHSHTPRADGSKAIDLQLHEPVTHVKSVYFLINSGNSKRIYVSEKIGEITLSFDDAPPMTVELVLGQNIREWCVGNPGDLVRETSNPLSKVVWWGMNRQGVNAIIDCLEIPVYESMRRNALRRITLVHRPMQKGGDTLGVHFSVYGISLQLAEGIAIEMPTKVAMRDSQRAPQRSRS